MPVSALRSFLLVSTILLGGGLLLTGGLVAPAPSGPHGTAAEPVSTAPVDTQHVALDEGVNLVSSRIYPDTPNLASVFAPIASSIEEVRDTQDRVYRPGGVNEIGDWEPRAVYEVYASSSATLVLEGTRLSTEVPIALQQGWNRIPYLHDASIPVEEALSSISSSLVMIKDGRGRKAYVPSEGVNEIGQLAPGEAYKINVSKSVNLSYSDGGGRTYAPACLQQSGAVAPSDYGEFVADTPNDSLQRVANAQSLNAAIDDAPMGGVVCLPQGDYYLLPDVIQRNQAGSIEVERDSVTVWGAGRNEDGNGTGLHTRGEYSVVDGKVVRGSGINFHADRATGNEIDGVVLRDFELDGNVGDGHTGNYGWPADTEDGSGWDITHKGINLSAGGSTKEVNVEVRNVWVHSYRGEQIYYGGNSLGTAIFDNIISEDTNASTFNMAGDSVIVKNSEFGLSRFWVEIGPKQADDYGHYANNYFHDAAKQMAFVFSGGAGYQDEYLIENNTFEDCNFGDAPTGRLFQFSGGLEGSTVIRENTMSNCGGAMFTTTPANEAGPARDVTIENNTIQTRGGDLFYFFAGAEDIIVRENYITVNLPEGESKNGSALTSWGGSSLGSVLIKENTIEDGFHGLPRYELNSGAKRPLHVQNAYTGSSLGFTRNTITSEDPLVDPFMEKALVRPEESSVEVDLATEHVPDGQVTTFEVDNVRGPSGAEVIFSPTNATYDVPEEKRLTDGQTLTMQYDESDGYWVEPQ
jgi:hypothetical protein